MRPRSKERRSALKNRSVAAARNKAALEMGMRITPLSSDARMRRLFLMEKYLQEDFKKSMKIRLNFNNMMDSFVGEKGLSEEDLAALSGKIADMEKAMVEVA